MKLLKTNRNLAIIALIAVVNALGYGIVFPILYSYSQKYGLSDFDNGLLFALFSICQFISTPIIGRLSDRYGRRPLFVISISGTFFSFIMMALAPSAFFLFLARALDGLTAGNLPVAQAVISDTTETKHRARGFGIIGAAFGFGFIFGPAISALTVGISPATPFIIAAAISFIAVLVTALFLPETNKHLGEVKLGKLFDLKKLYNTLFDPNVGTTFVISLFYFLAFSLFIYAFQPYSVKILKLSANQISLLFMAVGVVGLITQTFLVQRISKIFGLKKTFSGSILVVAFSFLLSFLSSSFIPFFIAMLILGFSNGLVQPLVNTILSQETDEKSQGSVMGLNVSYGSIGQIVGPIAAGAIATIAISLPFLAGSIVVLFCFFLSFKVLQPGIRKESTF